MSPPGPIAVRGYPHPIWNGMNDPASYVGWTKDGASFGYCGDFGGRDPRTTSCELVDAAGKLTTMSSDDAKGDFDSKKMKAIDALLKNNAVPKIKDPGDPKQRKPGPLVGTWTFTDITLVVACDGKPATVRVGGSVGAEAPVFPITLKSTDAGRAPPHFSAMNGMFVSPNGLERPPTGNHLGPKFALRRTVQRRPTLGSTSNFSMVSVELPLTSNGHSPGVIHSSAGLFQSGRIKADPPAWTLIGFR